jgi:Acyl-CoA dehydrogenases
LTPVIKLYSGKMSSEVVKEGMECIEGVGYMESSGIPQLLRDTEVYSI